MHANLSPRSLRRSQAPRHAYVAGGAQSLADPAEPRRRAVPARLRLARGGSNFRVRGGAIIRNCSKVHPCTQFHARGIRGLDEVTLRKSRTRQCSNAGFDPRRPFAAAHAHERVAVSLSARSTTPASQFVVTHVPTRGTTTCSANSSVEPLPTTSDCTSGLPCRAVARWQTWFSAGYRAFGERTHFCCVATRRLDSGSGTSAPIRKLAYPGKVE